MKTYYYVDRQTMQELVDLLTILKKSKWFWQRWGIKNAIVAKLDYRMHWGYDK